LEKYRKQHLAGSYRGTSIHPRISTCEDCTSSASSTPQKLHITISQSILAMYRGKIGIQQPWTSYYMGEQRQACQELKQRRSGSSRHQLSSLLFPTDIREKMQVEQF